MVVARYLLLFVSLACCNRCAHAEERFAEPRAEFRAVWIATVANIDWPSEPGLTAERQQAELIDLLDLAKRLNFNAIVFQVRPACDALYESSLEPWSEFLFGEMGQPPEPFYDPLHFAVRAAHERGLELHAWFNPYRALHKSAKGPVSADHISRTHPELVRNYGDYLWLDPGASAAAEHSLAVMLDVVRRYDIDGIHMDDYFYPYPITTEVASAANGDALQGGPTRAKVPFPDDETWQQATSALPIDERNKITRDDWRRQNIDQFVERLYREVHRAKPWVKVGISPFGIWRPGHPPQIKGFDQYNEIYADARKWLQAGWVDYFTPQLYWKIGPPEQSFPALLDWWCDQNGHGRHIWPGLYTSRLLGRNSDWSADEIIAQIWATRAQNGATGTVHFSMKAIARNADGIADKLLAGPFREPARIPDCPWLSPRPSSDDRAEQ